MDVEGGRSIGALDSPPGMTFAPHRDAMEHRSQMQVGRDHKPPRSLCVTAEFTRAACVLIDTCNVVVVVMMWESRLTVGVTRADQCAGQVFAGALSCLL